MAENCPNKGEKTYLDLEDAEFSRPCKRKRTCSNDTLDHCEVKSQHAGSNRINKVQGLWGSGDASNIHKTFKWEEFDMQDETSEIKASEGNIFNNSDLIHDETSEIIASEGNRFNNSESIQDDKELVLKSENKDSSMKNQRKLLQNSGEEILVTLNENSLDSPKLRDYNLNTSDINQVQEESTKSDSALPNKQVSNTILEKAHISPTCSSHLSDSGYTSDSEKLPCNKETLLSNKETLPSNKDMLPINKDMLPSNKEASFFNSRLPPHILVQIFKHLSISDLLRNASLVCRTWYHLSHDPDLWRVIDLRLYDRVTDGTLLTLTSYSDRVMLLDLTDAKDLTCVGISEVIEKCKHLQTLKLSRYYKLTDAVVKSIGENCHKLQRLYLELCFKITDDAIKTVAVGCPNLTELQLTQCKNMSDDGIIELAKHCHELKHLMLDHCGRVTDRSVIELPVGCPLLESVALAMCHLTDKSIIELRKLKKLRILDISNMAAPGITPISILQIVQHCIQLECLNLSLNRLVDDECIEMIAKYGHNLKRLYCVSCQLTDAALEMIGQYSKTIEHLDVGWCRDITDEGVKTISMSCPSLRYLGLIRCDHVTIETMEELVEQYPHIEYSTFVLASKRLIEKARQEGFRFETDVDS